MYRLLSIILFSLLSFSKNGIEVISQDKNHITISFKPHLDTFETIITNDGTSTVKPLIEGSWLMNSEDEGSASVFVVSELITVPSEQSYNMEIINVGDTEEIDNYITPVPYKNYTSEKLEYEISQNYFQTTTDDLVNIEYLGISSGEPIARINFVACKFDPHRSKILIPSQITIRINFDTQNTLIDEFDDLVNPTLNTRYAQGWIDNKKKSFSKQNGLNISSGKLLKIKIGEEGIYKVTRDDLAKSGVEVDQVDLSTIKIFGWGLPIDESIPANGEQFPIEQNIIVNQNNGSLEDVVFYASPSKGFTVSENGSEIFKNWYSDDKYYILTWGGKPRKNYEVSFYDGQIDNRPEFFYKDIYYEEEEVNLFLSGSGREFLSIFSRTKELEFNLPNLIKSDKIFYEFSLGHHSNSSGNFSIYENSQQIITGNIGRVNGFIALQRRKFFVTASSDNIPDQKSRIKIEYDGSSSVIPYFDYLAIHYPHPFSANSDNLNFITMSNWDGGNEVVINNFSDSEKYIFDVTDPNKPIPYLNSSENSNEVVLRFLQEDAITKKFSVSANPMSPLNLELMDYKYLADISEGSDIILITDEELLESANNYKNYRESQGKYSVSIFTTNDIYNEFGAGNVDIGAIRNFVSHSYYNWQTKPKFLFFWGDAHPDLKGVTTNKKVYVPTYQTVDSSNSVSEISSTSYDDFFALVDGEDNLVDIAMGRLPIFSDSKMTGNQRGNIYIDKLNKYENESAPGNWRTRLTLVADDGYTPERDDGQSHVRASEDLSNMKVMEDFVQDKIYIVEYNTEFNSDGRRKPEANDAILDAMNDGSLLLNWSGHGNPRVWAHEAVFDQNKTLNEINNSNKMFFLCAATCEFGRYDQFGDQSSAEEMLFLDRGSAIAVFAATRLVFQSQNADLNETFFDQMFTINPVKSDYDEIGEVLRLVKQRQSSSNDKKYLIMGDPSLRLALPEYKVKIQDIVIGDDQLSTDSELPLELEGLIEYQINGIIEDFTENKVNDFNGTVNLNIHDGDKEINLVDAGSQFRFSKYGGILNTSSTTVTTGEFSVKIILPKDLSYSDNLGRMFAFAQTTDQKRFANGSFNNFSVTGISENALNDSENPDINIFLDSRDFVEYDLVSNEPILIVDLKDNIGINLSGTGLGHNVQAWVNDSNAPLNLQIEENDFSSEEKVITMETKLTNLEPGLNIVTVRAWDLFNNYSVSEVYFNISELENDIQISNIKNYPNPFIDNTNISFQHNLEPGFSYQINIYDLFGRLIRTLSGQSFDRFVSSINWDGLDENMNQIISGSYIIQINVTDLDGHSKNNSGIIGIRVR